MCMYEPIGVINKLVDDSNLAVKARRENSIGFNIKKETRVGAMVIGVTRFIFWMSRTPHEESTGLFASTAVEVAWRELGLSNLGDVTNVSCRTGGGVGGRFGGGCFIPGIFFTALAFTDLAFFFFPWTAKLLLLVTAVTFGLVRKEAVARVINS
jgi:hypothetical protein